MRKEIGLNCFTDKHMLEKWEYVEICKYMTVPFEAAIPQ